MTTRQCNDERLTDFSLAYGCRYFGLKYLAKSSVNAQHLQRGQQARLKAHGFASIRRCWHMADGKESAIPAIRAAFIGLGWRLRTHLQFQNGSAMLGWDDQGKTWSLGGGSTGRCSMTQQFQHVAQIQVGLCSNGRLCILHQVLKTPLNAGLCTRR